LAIDLGTCNTVAVVRRGAEAPRPLLFDGSPLLPSGVYAGPGGQLFVGRDAERMLVVDPARFEPYPKRRIDDGRVLLGDAEVPVVELLAAVLRRVVAEAAQAGVPAAGSTVLTCPVDWGVHRRGLLQQAARLAGIGDAPLVDEPIAAATYCVEVMGRQVLPGQVVTVFDFGGGTLDVTVVRREAGGPRVLGTGGLDDLGGVDVDAALVGHLGQLISLRSGDAWRRLASPTGTGELRDRRAFWAEIRGAKEMLSRTAAAPVHVPGAEHAVHLTREELDRVAGPLVDRAVDETRRLLQRVGVEPGQLAAVLLVGGSSRIPLVASRLHARFGVPPAVPEQPELPVAHGALLAAETALAAAGTAAAPTSGMPTSGVPTSGVPTSGVPVSGRPTSGMPGPVSGGPGYPAPGYPGSGYPGPVSIPPAPGGSFPPRPTPASRRRRRARLAVVAVVALALIGGVGWAGWAAIGAGGRLVKGVTSGAGLPGQSANGLAGAAAAGSLTEVADIKLAGEGASGSAADAELIYHASAGVDGTEVVAQPVGAGGRRWTQKLAMVPAVVRIRRVADLVVVDGERSGPGNQDARAVLTAADGKLLWQSAWGADDRLSAAFLGTDEIVELREPPAVERIDLRTGKPRWRRTAPADLLLIDARRIGPVLSWPTGAPAPNAGVPVSVSSGVPPATAIRDELRADPGTVVELNDNGSAHVLDAATGAPRVSGKVPLDLDHWIAMDGMMIGAVAGSGQVVLAAYDLATLTKKWEARQLAGVSLELVKPCGPGRVCIGRSGSGREEIVSYDVATGAEVWRRQPQGTITDAWWYVLDRRLVVGSGSFGYLTYPQVWDPATGNPHGALGERGQTVVAGSGGRVVLRYAQASVTGTSTAISWRVGVVDVGRLVGAGGLAAGNGDAIPRQVSLDGDLVTVATGDGHVRVGRLKDLAAKGTG
jgi:actin-like ATPase involved in cell morphogenesis